MPYFQNHMPVPPTTGRMIPFPYSVGQTAAPRTPMPSPSRRLVPLLMMLMLGVGITALMIWWRKRGALGEAETTLRYVAELGDDGEGREAQAEALATSIMDIARNKIFNWNLSPNARLRYGLQTMEALAKDMEININQKVWSRAFGLAARQFGPGMRAEQSMFQLGG